MRTWHKNYEPGTRIKVAVFWVVTQCSDSLKMEAARSSETLRFWHHNPEHHNFILHPCENLKPRIMYENISS
jgi:hypothetical protein